MDEAEKKELIDSLNASHERFITGLLSNDRDLCMLAYKNYVRTLALLLDEVL